MSNDGDVEMKEATLVGRKRFSFKKVLADTLQGRIYLAKDKLKNEWVVVKETWKELVRQKRSRDGHAVPEDFENEKAIQMFLSAQPNADTGFVRTIAEWEDENCNYLAMEYCGGGELFEYVRKMHTEGTVARQIQDAQRQVQRPAQKPSAWGQRVQDMFQQLIRTVSWMHRLGVCHLDLSLENTMIGDAQKMSMKIIDFGLGRRFPPKGFTYRARVGKTGYMAPEVYSRRSYDPRLADIWSLGVMLFMMLVGAPPYEFPSQSNPAFRFIIGGRLRDVLSHWRRLPLVTSDALNLMESIFKPEKARISMDDIRKHPYVKLGDFAKEDVEMPTKTSAEQPAVQGGDDSKRPDDDDQSMDDRDPSSPGGGGGPPPAAGDSGSEPTGAGNAGQNVAGDSFVGEVNAENRIDFTTVKQNLKTKEAQDYAKQVKDKMPENELRDLLQRLEAAMNRIRGEQSGPKGNAANIDSPQQQSHESTVKELKTISLYVRQCLPTPGQQGGPNSGGAVAPKQDDAVA